VRDGARFAGHGLPTVSLVTEKFWSQGNSVAAFVGLPDLPRVQLPHPVAGLERAAMQAVAADVADAILAGLRGA
jgi:hypothetical protein